MMFIMVPSFGNPAVAAYKNIMEDPYANRPW